MGGGGVGGGGVGGGGVGFGSPRDRKEEELIRRRAAEASARGAPNPNPLPKDFLARVFRYSVQLGATEGSNPNPNPKPDPTSTQP